MLFRNPLAWIGLAAVVVPLAVHLLVRAPAVPVVLASLRFVPASAMRALRRRLVNDVGLLALRMGILALAVGALVDPLATSACRVRAWNARVARAVIVDTRSGPPADASAHELPSVFASREIAVADLRAGLGEAVRWIEQTPPARREIVIVSDVRLGSLDATDLTHVPASIGLRFVRSGRKDGSERAESEPVASRQVVGPEISRRGENAFTTARSRVTVDGERTSATMEHVPGSRALAIEDTASGLSVPALAFEGIAPEDSRAALRAAVSAALVVGVPVQDAAERPVVLVLETEIAGTTHRSPTSSDSIPASWMGEAMARISADTDLAGEARASRASVRRPLGDNWAPLIRDAEGFVLVAAATGSARDRPGSAHALWLLVRTKAISPVVPTLVRSALQARAPDASFADAEVLSVPDAQLEQWARPAPELDADSLRNATVSDRRWVWFGVLALLGVESWARRAKRLGGEEDASSARAA